MGYYTSFGKETCPSLTRPQLLPRARGASPSLGLLIYGTSRPALDSYPANDVSQGPGTRRQALGYRCPGAPRRCSLGMPQPTAPRQGHVQGMTQEDKASHGLQGLGGF
jgi:hypothetical protein